jgi:hypothetical protein
MPKQQAQRKDVFVISKNGTKSFWNRCGVAFVNKDDSLNVKLDLFPDVQFQIRDPKEEKDNGREPGQD